MKNNDATYEIDMAPNGIFITMNGLKILKLEATLSSITEEECIKVLNMIREKINK